MSGVLWTGLAPLGEAVGKGAIRGGWKMRMKESWAWSCADVNKVLLFSRNDAQWDQLESFPAWSVG